MRNAQPLDIVPVLEPELRAAKLSTIGNHKFIRLASGKLNVGRYRTLSTITMWLYSLGVPSHVLISMIPVLSSWVRRSSPVLQHSRTEVPEICLSVPRTTRSSNPSSLIQHCNPTAKSSDEFMGYDKSSPRDARHQQRAHVVLRGMERKGFPRHIYQNVFGKTSR